MDHYFGGEKGFSRRPKEGSQSNQFFSDALQRHQNVQEKQMTPSILSSLLNRVDNAEEGAVTNANMAVDLEGFMPGVRPKGKGSKK